MAAALQFLEIWMMLESIRIEMQKFNSLKSIPAYLPIVNIDTDMIIPKQFS